MGGDCCATPQPRRGGCWWKAHRASSMSRSIRGGRVVREKDLVAVVAPREWDAVRAAQMLKVDWHALDGAFPAMDQLHEHIRSAKVVKREEPVKKGDLAAAFSAPGVRIVEAQYEWPFQSHASMGPGCAVADARV